MKKVRLFYLIVLMLFACAHKNNIGENTSEDFKELSVIKNKKKIIIPEYLIPVFDTVAKHNIFYLFNGGCSKCVSSLIETIKNISDNKGVEAKNTEIYFIDINRDTSSVSFFFDQHKITIENNQHLIPDLNSEFMRLNNIALPSEGASMILTDEMLMIKEQGNPLNNDEAMALYNSLGILSK